MLDLSTANAARKLQHQIRGENFTVNSKKVKGMALQLSVLTVQQDQLASRILMLTDRHGKMSIMDSQEVKFILYQNSLACTRVEIRHVSRTRTEVHFSSWREAETVNPTLQDQAPGIHVGYGIDPATGEKALCPTVLNTIFTGEDLPDTNIFLILRHFVISSVSSAPI